MLRKLLRNASTPDAIFFASDVFAVGAILECRTLGVRVPDNEIGIAGFHDLEIGQLVSPTLTTVHVPALEIGRRAGQIILDRLSANKEPETAELPFRIVRRESTRPGR